MSCLFQSLCSFVGCTHESLRQRIVDYLSTNPELMEDVAAKDIVQWGEDKSLEAYVEEMKRTSVWGGSIEIKAFCDLFKMRVVVHIKNGGRVVEFTGLSQANGTVHIHWNGSHFEPMRRVSTIVDVFRPAAIPTTQQVQVRIHRPIRK
jgi:OTU-like cysteine protease